MMVTASTSESFKPRKSVPEWPVSLCHIFQDAIFLRDDPSKAPSDLTYRIVVILSSYVAWEVRSPQLTCLVIKSTVGHHSFLNPESPNLGKAIISRYPSKWHAMRNQHSEPHIQATHSINRSAFLLRTRSRSTTFSKALGIILPEKLSISELKVEVQSNTRVTRLNSRSLSADGIRKQICLVNFAWMKLSIGLFLSHISLFQATSRFFNAS